MKEMPLKDRKGSTPQKEAVNKLHHGFSTQFVVDRMHKDQPELPLPVYTASSGRSRNTDRRSMS